MNFNLLLVFLITGKAASFSSIQQRQNVPFKLGGSSLNSDDFHFRNSGAVEEDSENLDGRQQNVDKKDQPTSILDRSGQSAVLVSLLSQLEADFSEKIEEIKMQSSKTKKEQDEKIEEIKTQTSKTSKDQDEKIAIIRVRERNLAQILNQTREEMVGLKTQNTDQSKRIDQLEQKLATLKNTPPIALTKSNTIRLKMADPIPMVARYQKL